MSRFAAADHSRTAGLRRAIGLLLVAGLCACAVTFYRDALELPRSAPEITLKTPAPAAPASSATPVLPASPSQVKAPKGPGTTEPGVLLMASPMRDGSFDIAEMVRLPTAVSSVRLGPPELRMAGSNFAKLRPVASQVQLSAGDQPVVVPNGRVGSRMAIDLVEPTKKMELRYKLSEITVRSMPSRAGRALAAIRPLTSGMPELPVVVIVTGTTVLNMECPLFRQTNERACAAGQPPRLRVERNLRWRNAVVVVQFDLPRT